MASIYELTNDWLQLQEMIASGEYDEETLSNTLDCLDYEIEAKADGYAKIIKNLSSDVDGLKAEEKRLSDRRKAIENNITKLKTNLYEGMKTTGKEKFKTNLFNFNIQKNTPSVTLIGKIPAKYLIKQEPKTDIATIKKELLEGKKFKFAELTQGESLRIR